MDAKTPREAEHGIDDAVYALAPVGRGAGSDIVERAMTTPRIRSEEEIRAALHRMTETVWNRGKMTSPPFWHIPVNEETDVDVILYDAFAELKALRAALRELLDHTECPCASVMDCPTSRARALLGRMLIDPEQRGEEPLYDALVDAARTHDWGNVDDALDALDRARASTRRTVHARSRAERRGGSAMRLPNECEGDHE